MYSCNSCHSLVGPRVHQEHIITEVRPQSYHNIVERVDPETLKSWKDEVISSGTEIVTERVICPPCAGIKVSEVPKEITAAISARVRSVQGLQEHARKCKGFNEKKNKETGETERVSCKICDLIPLLAATLPLKDLTLALEDKQTPSMKTHLIRVAYDNLVDDKNNVRNPNGRDFEAAYPILKGYEQRGGGL